MTDTTAPRPAAPERSGPATAGGLLRQAREAQGMHIATLAAAIKVVPKKLEALEADRIAELPDATFARALAQAVCRTLKLDPAPVLALLPPLSGPKRLEEVAEGLNTPFRETPGRLAPREWARVTKPALGLALLIVVATLAVYLLPANWTSLFDAARMRARPEIVPGVVSAPLAVPLPGASAASGAFESGGTVPAGEPSAAAEPAPAAEAAALSGAASSSGGAVGAGAAPATGWLQLEATAPSWVGVTDARGKTLIFRLLKADERVVLDGEPPLKIRIGNANAVRINVRGAPFDLSSYTRDNVARLELK